MLWSANRCWSPTGRQARQGSQCWKPSASSPKNNWCRRRRRHDPQPRTPATSPSDRPMHWRGGIVRGNARLTTGSPPSLQTFAQRFAGPPIMTTSTRRPPSPSTQHFSGTSSNSGSPSRGLRNSSPMRKPSNIRVLAQLYVGASYCAAVGRADDFVRYAEAARAAIASGRFDDVYEGFECAVAAGYNTTGRPDLAVEWCRATIARNPGIPTHAQAVMAIALAVTGATDEAIAASKTMLAVAQQRQQSQSGRSLAPRIWLGPQAGRSHSRLRCPPSGLDDR